MSDQLVNNIYESLREVVGKSDNLISLHEPSFKGNEWNYVKDCLDTGWVSSVGSYVDKFERDIETYTGVKHAIAVVNGTAALHACLRVLDVGENDDVLIPAFTFIATANAIKYCNALPHFVDVERETLGIDVIKLDAYLKDISEMRDGKCFDKRTNRRIKAVMPMHTFGHPSNINGLMRICEKFNMELVEDAAESLGSFYNGKHTGGFGRVAALSFNGNKIVTTGGGGAILTNDSMLAKRLIHITKTSRVAHKWDFIHDEVGFNYRLPNLNASLGCAQLESLPEYLVNKRKLALKYEKAFMSNEEVDFFREVEGSKSNYWLNALILKEPNREFRNKILEVTNEKGIMTRPAWKLLPTLEPYKESPRMEDLTCAELLESSIINIPSSPFLGVQND